LIILIAIIVGLKSLYCIYVGSWTGHVFRYIFPKPEPMWMKSGI